MCCRKIEKSLEMLRFLQREQNTKIPVYLTYTNTTDSGGNLVLSGINGYILSVFPLDADLVIDKMFVSSGGARYVHLARQTSTGTPANVSVRVNVLYLPY